MIEVKGVSYSYNAGQKVLNNISFTVARGAWLTILGANASGKTTLAMMLNGLLLPQEGSVWVNGLNTADNKNLREIRNEVAFVFQNPDNQIVAATVEEDVAFGLCNLGLPRQDIEKGVREALSIVGMEAFREHSPHMLSGGQKQKVALAGALAMRPRYLVLDEACSMLDPKSRGEFWQGVENLHRQLGITVINISHFPDEALLGESILLLAAGKVVAKL